MIKNQIPENERNSTRYAFDLLTIFPKDVFTLGIVYIKSNPKLISPNWQNFLEVLN